MKRLLFIWQLPQIVVAAVLRMLYRTGRPVARVNEIKIYTWKLSQGISLGNTIIVGTHKSPRMIRHEYGHTKQSKVLGPLYLILIGLPSIVWAGIVYPLLKKHFPGRFTYESFFIESMATKLGADSDIFYNIKNKN